MRYALLRVIVMMGAVLPLAATAQGSDKPIDPVSMSPNLYKVILENEQVRVVEYLLKPGQRDEWHTHPPKVSYVVEGGTLRITLKDGKSFVAEEKAGAASWMATLGLHFAENIGKTPVKIVLVEVKSANHP